MDAARPVTADRTQTTNPFSFAGYLEQRCPPNFASKAQSFFLLTATLTH
jgi:hypothetical protein